MHDLASRGQPSALHVWTLVFLRYGVTYLTGLELTASDMTRRSERFYCVPEVCKGLEVGSSGTHCFTASRFKGRDPYIYPRLWHCDGLAISDCRMTAYVKTDPCLLVMPAHTDVICQILCKVR